MNNLKKWKAEEEERYKGSLIPPPPKWPKGRKLAQSGHPASNPFVSFQLGHESIMVIG
jgi:hypothetical protein